MKFAHLGDTHLSKKDKIKERSTDFEVAFEKAVDSIIEKNVDFVIHSGDLFDTGKPEIESILFCMEQLEKLKKVGIKFYVIKGSHDVGFGETKTIIDLLEQAGYLINLSSPRYLKEDTLSGEKIGNVYIFGVWGKKSGIKDFYEKVKISPVPNFFNIFLFHQAVSLAKGVEMFADIDAEHLPKGFDYYASGHWHGREELKYDNKPLIYPGSLENCNVDEMLKNDKKGYYLVNTETGNYEFVEISTRKVKVVNVKAEGENSEELMKKAIALMGESGNEKEILVIVFSGEIEDKRTKIDKGYLSRISSEKGYLFTSVSLSKLKELEGEDVEIKQTNVNKIEEEYLTAKGYDKSEIELAREIMEIVGRKLTPSELDKETERVKKIIEMYAK